jgi:hypothetical protein
MPSNCSRDGLILGAKSVVAGAVLVVGTLGTRYPSLPLDNRYTKRKRLAGKREGSERQELQGVPEMRSALVNPGTQQSGRNDV